MEAFTDRSKNNSLAAFSGKAARKFQILQLNPSLSPLCGHIDTISYNVLCNAVNIWSTYGYLETRSKGCPRADAFALLTTPTDCCTLNNLNGRIWDGLFVCRFWAVIKFVDGLAACSLLLLYSTIQTELCWYY